MSNKPFPVSPSAPRAMALSFLAIFGFLACAELAQAQSLPAPDFSRQETVRKKAPGSVDMLRNPTQGSIEAKEGEKKLSLKELSGADRNGNPYRNSALSDETMQKLDEILVTQGSDAVLRAISKTPDDPKLMDWLQARARQGHVPLMWEIAERSSASEPLLSIYWGQAALLGLRQEATICLEYSAGRNAPADYLKRFPRTPRASAANPWRIKEGVDFALKLFTQIKSMPDPTLWLCKPYTLIAEMSKKENSSKVRFSERTKQGIFTYDPKYWDELRRRERNAFREQVGQPKSSMEANTMSETNIRH